MYLQPVVVYNPISSCECNLLGETFSPVEKMNSIYLVLSLVASHKCIYSCTRRNDLVTR
jgi:hypothetical protein